MNIEEINNELQRKRHAGRVTVRYDTRYQPNESSDTNPITVVDKYVETLGFRSIGSQWRIIDSEEAQKLLQKIIGFDLAYGDQLMDCSESEYWAKLFLSQFSPQTLCLTNGVWDTENVNPILNIGPSWIPLTASTFDAGVVCINSRELGLLWIEDED